MQLIHFQKLCLLLVSAFLAALLAACGHTPVTRTVWDAAGLGGGKGVDALNLNPDLQYLRLTVRGRVVLMVLGYVDTVPEGVIETWYSSQGEVIRLQNGRVVSTAGLETDWRAVRNFDLPSWKTLTGNAANTPATYRRERDEMPGYRYGVAETVSLYAVRTPTNAKLAGLSAQELRWYEETVAGQGGLPSARYALRAQESEPQVIYGEQCLSPQFCLAWQQWPAKR